MTDALNGRCALITGSVQGIGLSTACALGAQGAKVMLTDIAPPGDLDRVMQQVTAAGAAAVAFAAADLTATGAIDALVGAAERQLGPPDILVNNAAFRTRESIETIQSADWQKAIAINLTAPFELIRRALPGMRSQGWGRIVNIASGFGLIGSARRIDYVTTKTGMIGLTRAVALDLIDSGITCNAVCPGSTWTPRQQARLDKLVANGLSEGEARERLHAMLGARRFLQPESIAAAVAYLCGDSAEDVTGVALPVDGGYVAGW